MSGTSARESYRSGKRTRPSDSQPSRMTPPVLFRLPSVAMPAQEPAADASNINSVAMAMPAASAAVASSPALAPDAATTTGTPLSATPSAPAQTAAATRAADKASGQRLLNTIIVVLLIAALAVIAWVSLNRPTEAPAMANNKIGNDSALDTLGELKVPDVSSSSLTEISKPKTETADSGLNLDEIKPASPSDLSLIDLPDGHKDDIGNSNKPQAGQPGSLMVGIDTASTPDPAEALVNPSSAPTAQIQLRTPVPMGSSNVTSLVDSQRSGSQLGNATPGSSTTAPVQTVSTPSPTTKVFPANPAYGSGGANANTNTNTNGTGGTSASSTNGSPTNSGTGSSPSLYDEAKRPSLEGLQLGGKPSAAGASTASTQVNISRPLAAEVAMPGVPTPGSAQPSTADVAQQAAETPAPDGGVTVGAGETAPYRLAKSRFDLDPVTFARIKASGADKSAVSGASPTAQTPINSYAGATQAMPGQNLYDGNYVKPAPGNSTPINSYAQAVPPGKTGNGTATYMPPAGSVGAANNQYANNQYANNQYNQLPANPNGVNQYGTKQYGAAGYPGPQTQLTNGPNNVPASTAGYSLPARGTQMNYGPNTATAPNAAGYYQPNFTPNYQQPGAQQPGAPAPNNAQPQYVPSNYAQPSYGTPPGTVPYGQPNAAYGNPAYASPSMNLPTGLQGAASYPTKNPYPGGQAPVGMIGPLGPATQPTGDFTPVPVMGRGGVGSSTPYGAPQ